MFLEILIVFIIIVFIMLLVFYTMRRRADKLIETIETRKKVLFDRPVIEQLNTVKKIALSGATKEAFEEERQRWETIVDVDLPKVEKMIDEMEQDNEMFRFTSIKPAIAQTEQRLAEIEQTMDQISDGLALLQKAHTAVGESLQKADADLVDARKVMLTQAYTFGDQIDRLETEEKRLRSEITTADTDYREGDFLAFYRRKAEIEDEIAKLNVQIIEIPPLLQQLNHDLPNEFIQLSRGYNSMKAQGYSLRLIDCDGTIARLNAEIKGVKSLLNAGDNQEAFAEVERMTSEVNALYDQLEAEAVARQFVEAEQLETEQQVQVEKAAVDLLYAEAKLVFEKYELDEEMTAKPETMRKHLKVAEQAYDRVKLAYAEGTVDHSQIATVIKDLQQTVCDNRDEQLLYSEQLKKIRKDEMAAQAKAQSYLERLKRVDNYIRRCRIPGVPTEVNDKIEAAYAAVTTLDTSLEASPINVSEMTENWRLAGNSTTIAEDDAHEMVEDARLVEAIIQYANRYRFKNQEMAMQLQIAESYYDSDYNYKKALEIAAKQLEKVESGAVGKVEAQLKEGNHQY